MLHLNGLILGEKWPDKDMHFYMVFIRASCMITFMVFM